MSNYHYLATYPVPARPGHPKQTPQNKPHKPKPHPPTLPDPPWPKTPSLQPHQQAQMQFPKTSSSLLCEVLCIRHQTSLNVYIFPKKNTPKRIHVPSCLLRSLQPCIYKHLICPLCTRCRRRVGNISTPLPQRRLCEY